MSLTRANYKDKNSNHVRLLGVEDRRFHRVLFLKTGLSKLGLQVSNRSGSPFCRTFGAR